MTEQALLPIFQPQLTWGRPDLEDRPQRCNDGVEYRPLATRKVLNRCLSPRLPFVWTINPYRGCEFGCTYCYARYTHHYFQLKRWQDFERKIFFKSNAAEALLKQLRRSDLRGQPIAIGTATDPYQPAERHFEVTRSLLRALRQAEGLDVAITTKSPLILRDLELLCELDRVHTVTVNMTLTTLDPRRARKLEQRAPEPQARLRAVRRLTASGIATNIYCMPLMPGINDDAENLAPLFSAARDAGAFDVVPSPLFLRPAARDRFLPWLSREFPGLVARYRRLYGRRDFLSDADRTLLLTEFRHLRLLYGFPRPRLTRG